MACKNLNAMIRNRGLSAHEIMFSRDDATNKNLHLSDKQLAEKQLCIKQYNNSLHSKTSNSENYNQGDLIAVNSEKNKHNARDVYYIDKVFPNKLQVNKIIRFHSSNPRLQTRHRIVQKNDVFSVKPNHTTMITKDSPSPSFEPKPAKSHPQPWCAFPQYSNIDDIDDDDKGSPKDPYEALKRWETKQRQYAKRSLSYDICSPKPVNNQPQHKETLVSESTQGDWDHQFDTHSPTYMDTDDDDFQDVFENIDFTLTPMSRVQSVDQLYEDNNLNVNTNQCQNLEHVLPKPKPVKKRVSPPRQLLPLEQEDLQHGIMTRSMQSNVRLTSSNDNATPTSSKEKVVRRRNAQ